MNKVFAFTLLLVLNLAASVTAVNAQAWSDATSAGDSGAQKRTTYVTDHQAEFAPQAYTDPVFFMPVTGTGEVAHGSVNHAAIPSGRFNFGFTGAPSFPIPGGGALQSIIPPGVFPGGPFPTPITITGTTVFPGGPGVQVQVPVQVPLSAPVQAPIPVQAPAQVPGGFLP